MPPKIPIQHLQDDELLERMNRLALVMHYNDGRLVYPEDVAELFSETLRECNRRNLEKCLEVPKIIKPEDPPPIIRGELIRYDKRQYLENLAAGTISFAPARTYKTADTAARRDDEQKRRFRFPNQIVTIDGIKYPATKIVLNNSFEGENGSAFDYHIFCLSYEESRKLGRDFAPADGYVRIKNPRLFWRMVEDELRRVCPDGKFAASIIKYYDELDGREITNLYDLIFSKTIEFIYQREFRIAAVGLSPNDARFEIQISPPDGLFEIVLF